MEKDNTTTNWKKIYIAVFITGIAFILLFWGFTALFNSP